MRVRLEPVTLLGVEEGEGVLAYCDDRLIAVMVRLAEDHGSDATCWFVEKGFGPLDRPTHPMFRDLAEAEAWLKAECADRLGPAPPSRG
jgi:hypothetical protein